MEPWIKDLYSIILMEKAIVDNIRYDSDIAFNKSGFYFCKYYTNRFQTKVQKYIDSLQEK